jgi:PAS domain S-box-containing protein
MGEAAENRAPETQLFHDVFNASPIGIAVENLEGQPLFVNPAFCSFLGFSEEELRHKHCVDFSPPEDAQKDWALFQQLKAGSIDHYQLEKRYFRKDGSLVWGRLSISLLKSHPSPLVIAMVEDITDKRTAEEAVRVSEERLRLAQQAARIGTFERNIRTGVVSWTPEMESLYGLPPGGFGQTRRAFENLIHPDDRVRVMELVDCALKTGEQTTGEWRVLWPDGGIHWIAGRWQAFMDESGKPFRVVGANMDVTSLKRTEEALLEVNLNLKTQAALLQSREELLKIFVKNVPAGVAMLDRDMRYLQVSDRWCADYSVDSSQILGRSLYELLPDIPQHWKEMHRRALEGETVRADEDRWDREGGTTTWVRWEIRPWSGPSGIVGGILIFAEDITHRKQMEEAMSGMSRKLIEAHEEERTWIARELHDDVNQRMALLAIELDRWNQQLPPSAVELHDHMHHASQRLSDIAKDIQALSHRLHSSKLEYLGLVAAAKSFCKELSEQQKVEIDFSETAIPRSVPKEISLCLFRVLQETLQNAVKHSGVRCFKVELCGTGGEIQLTVSDPGVGFDSQDAMYRRGLGLISMRERIQLVRGKFHIKSHPGSGTTIHARVPFDSGSDSARAAD